jgi:transcriptional regulator GlxA family with amidase domain
MCSRFCALRQQSPRSCAPTGGEASRSRLDQLAQLVLAYALRWLDSDGKSPARTGWLRALADTRIGAALSHIHSNVETGTSLVELARVAGMSRTAFAARFKELAGQPPRRLQRARSAGEA